MSISRYLSSGFVIAEFEVRKLRHDWLQILMRSIQPVLWLVVFGSVLSKIRAIPTGDYTYLQFITPGILAQSVMFVAMFYGVTLVSERDAGLLNKLLSTPAPNSSIVFGKALSAGVRGIFQAIAVFILALLLRVDIILNPLNILGALVTIVVFGMLLSSFSMCMASLMRTRERTMGIGQVIIMPLFFASNAIYPVSLMPAWLKAIVTVNPLTYVVDALRTLLVTGDYSNVLLDMVVIILAAGLLIGLASVIFRRLLS